jgi:hypothetical protein
VLDSVSIFLKVAVFDVLFFRAFFLVGIFLAMPLVVPSVFAQEQAKDLILTEEGDKNADSRLLEIMQILYVNSKYQSPFDRVEIRGSEAFIQVWRDLPPNPVKEKLECQGYQWLLSGRGEKMGYGAIEVFEQFKNLQSIQLELVEVDRDVKSVDKRGKLEKDWKPKVYLRFKLMRDDILKFKADQENLKRNLRKDQASCLKIGRRVNLQKDIQL